MCFNNFKHFIHLIHMLLESLLSNRKESGSEKYLPIWEIFEKLSDTELKTQPVNIDISSLGLSLLAVAV